MKRPSAKARKAPKLRLVKGGRDEREVSCADGFCPKPAWLVAFETVERESAAVRYGNLSGSTNLEGFQRLAVASDLGLDFEIPGLGEKTRSGR